MYNNKIKKTTQLRNMINSNKLELKNVEDVNKLISYGSSKNIFLIPK